MKKGNIYMRLFVFKLSSGGYYRSGYATGQKLCFADFHDEDDLLGIMSKSMFIKENIDYNFKLTELDIKEV